MRPMLAPINRKLALAVTQAVGLVMILLMANGCGGSPARSGASAQRTDSASHSSTASPRPLTDGEPCPLAKDSRVPSGSGCLTSSSGDFDGDRSSDQWLVYAHPLDAKRNAVAWHMLVILSSGATISRGIPDPGTGTQVWSVGAAAATGDGRDELFARIGGGAATDLVSIYYVRAGTISRVAERGKGPVVLTVGGTVRNVSGARCDLAGKSSTLIVTSASSENRKQWHTVRRVNRWRGHELALQTVQRATVGSLAGRYSRLQCGSLSL
jgi:hypothetical protein